MHALSLTGEARVAAAVVFGFLVGFILVKSGLSSRHRFFDLTRLADTMPLKTVLIAVAAGAILFHLCDSVGLVNSHFRPGYYFWAVVVGALLTGVGLAFCGQFPAAALANLGAGRLHALWTILGMALAIPLLGLVNEPLSNTLYSWSPPFTFHERLDEYASAPHAVLGLAGVCLLVAVFLDFTLGDGRE